MSSTILNLTARSPIDGTESAALATSGANWKATLNAIFTVMGAATTATLQGADANGITFSAATSGNSPSIAATGSDTVVGIIINGQGTNSAIKLQSGGKTSLSAFSDTSAVNYIQINGADTGGNPQLGAAGSDTNVTLNIFAQGNGNINFTANAAVSFVVQGDVASPVNFLVAHSQSTGVPAYLGSFSGTDTNVDVGFNPQGSGGFGYMNNFGKGGTVTQITSRTTGVTLNTITGQITLFTTAPTVGTPVTFTVTNSAVKSTDAIILNVVSSTNVYEAVVTAISGGTSFNITITSLSGNASDTPVIGFVVIRGATS